MMENFSFWADEAYLAGLASQFLHGSITFANLLDGASYQKLHILIITFAFYIFGISENVARLPSILFFILGGITMFFLARRLSTIYGAILSTFLYFFSTLNLAYAVQAKQAIHLEALLLVELLFIANLMQSKKTFWIIGTHVGIITISLVSTFLHYIGVLLWIPYFSYLVFLIHHTEDGRWKIKKNWILLISGVILIFLIFALKNIIYSMFLMAVRPGVPLFFNHSYQVVKLFFYKYSFISICGFFGYLWMFFSSRKTRAMSYAILSYSLLLVLLVTFKHYIFNIRYILPFFSILFLCFGIFWAKMGEKYDNNLKLSIFNLKLSGKAIIPLTILILLYATGYKIVRWPQAYYNPNIDKYGDVQIANYKDFYSTLKKQFPNYERLYVVNDTFDVEYWYFGRYSNAYFMKFVTKPYQHPTVKQAVIYGSLDDFKKTMKEHPHGLLIMEDWQSFLPDDVKEYAKRNLKLEFRVESLKEAPDDPWPLALYSWGF